MRDANAMQLSLNQIDLNVNAEMQLGKSGCWLNYSEGCQLVWRYNTSQVNTLFVWSSDLVALILVFCSREMTWLQLLMSQYVLQMREDMRRFPGTRGKFIQSVRIGKYRLIIL